MTIPGCASRALAQHEGHGDTAATYASPRFDFSAVLLHSRHRSLRGASAVGLRDWEHMRSRGFLDDRFSLRMMTSVGALLDRKGTPSLLQTGGTYRHAYIHDRQHPHDFLMEAAADLRLGSGWLYLAAVGSPSLGPSTYLHRPSAAADPVAPIGHHWQDATHVSYGVVGAGAKLAIATVEVSAFNARESDYRHPWPDFSHGRLDSFAGRVGLTMGVARVSAWWGYLKNHDPIAPAMQMHRYGASAAIDRGPWSSLAVWGMNVHHHDGASHVLLHGDPDASPHVRSSSVLVESNLRFRSRHDVFVRAERVMKNGEELGFFGGDLTALHEIRQVALGARSDLWSAAGVRFSVGVRGSLGMLPESLELAYGTRRPLGLDVFLQARPKP